MRKTAKAEVTKVVDAKREKLEKRATEEGIRLNQAFGHLSSAHQVMGLEDMDTTELKAISIAYSNAYLAVNEIKKIIAACAFRNKSRGNDFIERKMVHERKQKILQA